MQIRNYIGGELIAPVSGQYLDNYNPSTGEVYSQIPDSDHTDVQLAVDAAERVRTIWAETSIARRSEHLIHIAELIEENLEELALAESIDNGKPLWLAKSVDIPRAVENFRFFATAILHEAAESHQTSPNTINYTSASPVGIAGCISPWNLPLYLFTWKIAPALAAGCPVIAKPSEITPMTAYKLSEICIKAGLPAGVLNIVHGLGSKAGDAIIKHKNIPAISFTGGTQTGAYIASQAAPMFKKLSLELGGKNPNIIFADCNFDEMLKTTVASSFSNQGQICLCGSRIFVERPIYEKFRAAFIAKVSAMRIGNPLSPDSRLGTVVSSQHMDKVLSYIALGSGGGRNCPHWWEALHSGNC